MNRPGWGHSHTHEFKPMDPPRVIGQVEIYKCACGQTKHVIELKRASS